MSKSNLKDHSTKLKMMPGTQTGATYLCFARKGNIALGIKPYGFCRGKQHGVPGTTYFAARLRSAPAGHLFDDEASEGSSVVKFPTKNPENCWDAWPAVTWANKSASRASTNVSAFIKGDLCGTDAEIEELLGNVSEHKMATKMAEYLVKVAGPENLIITPRQLAEWIDGIYMPALETAKQQVAAGKALAKEFETTLVDNFGMESAVLKKVYDSLPKKADEVDDLPEGEDEPQENEGDPDDNVA